MNDVAFGALETKVSRAAVIGAGAMGGGIAAQFANAGIPVDLLDMPAAPGKPEPSEQGVARQLKAGGFMAPEAAALVRTGNVRDHLERVAQADWIVEAIIEDADAKRDLYRRIEPLRKEGALVSSNTSTLRRSDLVEGVGARFDRDFVITHFFNPPRHMQLLELVSGPGTAPAQIDRVRAAGRQVLGKTVVDCRDTPGFIANRVGCYWIAVGILEAERHGVTVEEADAVNSAFGVPKTGVFGLIDLIGIDLIPLVWGQLVASLPVDDGFHAHDLADSALSRFMNEKGLFGRKSGGGFYRKSPSGDREELDLGTRAYRPLQRPDGKLDLAALLDQDTAAGAYARSVLARIVAYTASVATDIAHDLAAIDTAVVLGYGWRHGPFALADSVGLDRVLRLMAEEGVAVPAVLADAAVRGAFHPKPQSGVGGGHRLLASNAAAVLEDGGDGLGVFRLKTKMGVFTPEVFDALDEALSMAGKELNALVIAPSGPRAFSAGADLASFLELSRDPAALEAFLQRGQGAFAGLRRAPIPVVAAVRGLALGGGCEITLHADHVVAHAEARLGLPETQLGILPGWGGTTRLYRRYSDAAGGDAGPEAVAARVMAVLLPGPTFKSAAEARAALFLDPAADWVMHPDDVEPAAIARARDMADGYRAPAETPLDVAGAVALERVLEATFAGHDVAEIDAQTRRVAEDLAGVLVGGAEGGAARSITEDEMRALERAAVLRMAAREETRAAMRAAIGR
jgi:3-hydroxyacyl-CoA dehydrogenase